MEAHAAIGASESEVSAKLSKTIVVIEDLKDLADVTVMLLEADGYRACSAGDGVAGLQLAIESHADLVLVDHMLPEMNGAEVGKALRALPEARLTKILMISAAPESVVRTTFRDYDEFIKKPYPPANLLEIVGSLLGQRSEAQRTAAPEPGQL